MPRLFHRVTPGPLESVLDVQSVARPVPLIRLAPTRTPEVEIHLAGVHPLILCTQKIVELARLVGMHFVPIVLQNDYFPGKPVPLRLGSCTPATIRNPPTRSHPSIQAQAWSRRGITHSRNCFVSSRMGLLLGGIYCSQSSLKSFSACSPRVSNEKHVGNEAGATLKILPFDSFTLPRSQRSLSKPRSLVRSQHDRRKIPCRKH